MLRPVRTLISLAFLGIVVWGMFTVRLGPRTFAEHVDRISETPQARELLQGARDTINPALEEAKHRVLGEYVEAPTYIPEGEAEPVETTPRAVANRAVHASTERTPSTASGARLPGRR